MDWAAYVNAYPDLAAAAAAEGRDPNEFGAAHYAAYGQGEGRVIPQEQSFAVEPPAAPAQSFESALPPSVIPLMDKMDWAAYTAAYPDLAAAAAAEGRDPTEFGRAHYQGYGYNEGRNLPNFVAQPQSPASPETSFAVNPTPATYPDYGVENVFGTRTAQLMPANEQFSTPYYEARTNTGDLAAAVGVDPTQRVRLIDPKTGEVFFEGTGPDAARMAVTQANVRSQDLGKNAGWSIEVAKPGEDWQEAGYESVDKKKSGLLGLIADIGLPILANLILPGSGFLATAGAAAAGSGVSSALQGRSLEDALLRAGVTGLTAGTLRGVGGGGSGASGGSYADAIARGYANTSANPLAGAFDIASNAAGNTVGEIVVNALPAAVQQGGSSVLSNAVGTGLGGLAGTVAGGIAGGVGAPTTVEGLDVTVPRNQGPMLDNSQLPVLFPELGPSLLDTTPTMNPPNTDQPGVGVPTDLAGLVVSATPGVVTPPANPGSLTPPPIIPPLTPTPTPTVPTGTGGLDLPGIIQLLTTLGVLGGGGGGGAGGSGKFGTRESLGPNFRASLPTSSTVRPFTPRTLDKPLSYYKTYGEQRPEMSFFEEIMQRGPERFAVGGGVDGPGTGRSDDIEARLSDGEYVIDAETVALLGDGSSKAGAAKLDGFRANVRKHKGKDLAKGKFSVNAKAPERYLSGGPV